MLLFFDYLNLTRKLICNYVLLCCYFQTFKDLLALLEPSHFIGGAKVRADILLAKNICKKASFLLDVFDLKIQIKNYLRKPVFLKRRAKIRGYFELAKFI